MSTPKAGTTHNLTISDGSRTWGLILDDGPRSIQQSVSSPSTLFINGQGKKWGDFDPTLAHLEQRTWSGGRGNEDFVNDPARFYDSQNLWTMVDERVTPSMRQYYASGYRYADQYQPDNISWVALLGDNKTIATNFLAGATYDAAVLYVWVRRRGGPGSFTISLRADNSGAPGTVLASSTIDLTDTVSQVSRYYIIPSAIPLTSGTKYHIAVTGSASDSASSRTEVGLATAQSLGSSYTSSDGVTWVSSTMKLWYRVTDGDTPQEWIMFRKGSSFYAVTKPSSGTSRLFSISYENDGVMTEITGHGLTVVTDVIWNGRVVYFAQGESTNIRRWDGGSNWADDGTNKATFLYSFGDPEDGPQVWRVNNATGTISASRATWQNWGTNLTFGTAITLGDAAYNATGLLDYNNALFVFKEDSIFAIQDDKATKMNLGTDSNPRPENGRGVINHGSYLMFSFYHTLLRMYGGTVDDVGPWHGAGIPAGRTGALYSLESVLSWLVAANDAGSEGTSAVLLYDDAGWHELARGMGAGFRIRSVKWHPGEYDYYKDELWFEMNGDLLFMKFPRNTMRPENDTDITYHPEGVLITSTFDMGANRLPKAWRDFTVVSKNLNTSTYIGVDYQVDDDIGTGNWTYLADVYTSPIKTIPVNVSNVYKIRFRLRMMTSVATTPPVLIATVLEGFARTPVKRQWVIKAKVSDLQTTMTGAPDVDPEKFLKWLQDTSQEARIVTLHSKTLKNMDGVRCIVEPPTPWYKFMSDVLKLWGGVLVVTLREI